MARIQQCRNGCGHYITVQEDQGKWKPFDVTEDGEVLDLHNCPKSPYNQQQGGGGGRTQVGQTTAYEKKPVQATQGGTSLDTKRMFNMLKELDERLDTIENKIDQKTILDTNVYVQQSNQIYNIIAPMLSTTGEKASSLLKKERQSIIDPISVDHGKKADEYETTKKFVTEKEVDLEDGDIDDDDTDDDDVEEIRTED